MKLDAPLGPPHDPIANTREPAPPRTIGRRLLLSALLLAGTAQAHDFRAGDIVVDHPYATPTPPGARTGALYFRGLKNTGRQGDRLLGARTDVAESVEIHRGTVDNNIMRMRAIAALDLPPGADIRLRHGGTLHLMLVGLKAPLTEGERFTAVLRFERGGEREVTVWVQQPRAAIAGHEHEH